MKMDIDMAHKQYHTRACHNYNYPTNLVILFDKLNELYRVNQMMWTDGQTDGCKRGQQPLGHSPRRMQLQGCPPLQSDVNQNSHYDDISV